MKILISAAETSSDVHGAELLKALRATAPEGLEIDAFGIGGSELEKVGLRAVAHTRDLQSMGFAELLGRLGKILSILRLIQKRATEENPDFAVVMDYPDFHFRLAKRLKRIGVPTVYYIPPKIWAWRTRRIFTIQKLFKKVFCIFPFEPSLYERAGVPALYVGNPVVDELPLSLTKAEARQALQIPQDQPVITLMPGSRPAEIKYHLEVMLEAALKSAQELKIHFKALIPLAPNTDASNIDLRIAEWLDAKSKTITGEFPLTLEVVRDRAAYALRASDAGIIKSGTSTLEAGLMGCPHVIIYQGTKLAWWIYQFFIPYRGPVGMVNLFLPWKKGEVFPIHEYLGPAVTAENLSKELIQLLSHRERRLEIRDWFVQLRKNVLPAEGMAGTAERTARGIWEWWLKESEQKLPVRTRRRINPELSDFGKILGSVLWSSVNGLRRWALKSGMVKRDRLEARVISVGNLVAGGAGKTPLVAAIAKEGIARGLQVAILTRGYKSAWELSGGILRPDQQLPEVKLCGDEPALLHELVPQVWIGVGANRQERYSALLREAGRKFDLVILDDGFQYLSIHKDVELLALSTSLPWWKRWNREWFSAARDANLLVWTKGDERPLAMGRPLVRIELKTVLDPQPSERILLVSAVGDPGSLEAGIRSQGVEIYRHERFGDHESPSEGKAWELFQESEREGCRLALTGKDWVKWREFGFDRSQVVLVEIDVNWTEGKDIWDQVLWSGLPSSV